MTLTYSVVDVFAEGRYQGNPLAVFRNTGHLSDAEMQAIAMEMNYSETTFILSDETRDGGWDVRIFTTSTEFPFAGHPTLGTAYIIRRELLGGQAERVTLNLKVGSIPVDFHNDGVLWMHQKLPTFGASYPHSELAHLLGLDHDDMDTRYPVQVVSTGLPWLIVPLTSLDAVRSASPIHERLPAYYAAGGLGKVFVFAPQAVHPENHVHTRGFLPGDSIPEDPATGSANGNLAAYLARYSVLGSQVVDVRSEQGYEIGRPSLLFLRAQPNGGSFDVHVGGRVIMIARGEWVYDR